MFEGPTLGSIPHYLLVVSRERMNGQELGNYKTGKKDASTEIHFSLPHSTPVTIQTNKWGPFGTPSPDVRTLV